MNKLDRERKAKKEIGEQLEILDTLGGDNRKEGIKLAKKLYKEKHDKSEKKDMDTVEKLNSANKSKEVYYRSILAECNLRMSEYSLPIGFRWIAKISEKGLAIYIGTPLGQMGGGVKVVGDPFIDAKGMIGLIRQALIDIDMIRDQWKIQSSIKTKN